MELSDVVIIVLLLLAIIVWIMNLNKKCIIVPCEPCRDNKQTNVALDLQFDERNFPSIVYDNMFNGRNVYQGAYSLDTGRSTIISANNQNQHGATLNAARVQGP